LLDLVQDSRRFILQNRWAVENAPLQTYASAVVFSPANCLVRRVLEKQVPHWIRTKPVVEDDWNPCMQTLESHGDLVNSVSFSPDRRYIASGSDDGTVKIWDAALGEVKQTREGHGSQVTSVSFSPDGRYIASGSGDCSVKIWDAASGEVKQTLEGHDHLVRSVAFSPDGRYIASGSDDQTVKIWDAASGEVKQTLEGHGGTVRSVFFSPDGRYITMERSRYGMRHRES